MSRSRKKQSYRRSRVFDRTCRNNGSCPYCRSNRQHAARKRQLSAIEQVVGFDPASGADFSVTTRRLHGGAIEIVDVETSKP